MGGYDCSNMKSTKQQVVLQMSAVSWSAAVIHLCSFIVHQKMIRVLSVQIYNPAGSKIENCKSPGRVFYVIFVCLIKPPLDSSKKTNDRCACLAKIGPIFNILSSEMC